MTEKSERFWSRTKLEFANVDLSAYFSFISGWLSTLVACSCCDGVIAADSLYGRKYAGWVLFPYYIFFSLNFFMSKEEGQLYYQVFGYFL